jgi:effector-binding domain-containing protein/uncharacterized protein YndB with AHSA1/START domain
MKNHLLVIGSVAIICACTPTEYQVKKEISINAPKEIVFNQVNNHNNRDAWSPWEKMDPNMAKSYEGPQEGVGAIYKWSGNDEVGTGELKIVESEPYAHIKSELVFTEPWESSSTVEWNFTNSENGTTAEWIISGQLPGFMFWMGQEDMEEAMGGDLENGLENLKAVSELLAVEAQNEIPHLVAEMVNVEGSTYYYIAEEVPFTSLNSDFLGTRYGEIMAYLGDESSKMTGAPFTIYHTWDEETEMTKMEVAVPCDSEKPQNDKINRGQTYSGQTVMCVFKGPYEGTEAAHNFLHQYITDNGMTMAGSPWEAYMNDINEIDNPDELITEIYYPISIAME